MPDTPDLLTRAMQACLSETRQALYEHGEITMAGLVRLDNVLGVETYDDEQGNGEDQWKHKR